MEQSTATDNAALLDPFLTEQELADELRNTVRTLRSWRQRKQGPPWVKIGSRVLYQRAEVAGWLRRMTVDPARRLGT